MVHQTSSSPLADWYRFARSSLLIFPSQETIADRTSRSDLCAVLRRAAARKLLRVAIDRKICAILKIENRHHPLA